jgi:DNA-binding SARP family transcriptional activator/DNA-binding GntR family transcriptional regulator
VQPPQFRILGPLEVTDGATAVPLPGGKASALLARLALDVNQTVAVDTIVDSLWGDDVPASAVKMIHVYVSQLRKTLPEGVLRTRAPGYALEIAPEAVDLVQLTRLRAEARAALADGDPRVASQRLREALSLWRGTALAEFSEPFAAAQAAHLDEVRIACLEDRIDADLALGQHADLIGELRVLVAGHPLRERLRCQLMLALYRAGRQAEALRVYQEFRRALQDELAIEPSAAMNVLQRQVLRQDEALDLAAPTAAPVIAPVDEPAEQLVGRAQELERLERALEAATAGRGTTALIFGPAGIGKTMLASQLVERARGRAATVLTGRCIDLVGAGLPYLPLIETIRQLGDSPALTGLRELPRLLPDLASGPPLPHGDGAESRLRLFAEVLTVLERLSVEAPVVLVLEDLHWADGSTLDLVAFLAHAVQERRILLVATYRTGAGQDVHRLGAGLRRVSATVMVELAPLRDEDVETLVAATVEDPEVAATVCARSEGNPFFAKELAAAAARGEHELPQALHELLLAEIARLDADSRALLRVVAAAGRDVPYKLLAAVMQRPEGSIVDALRQAVEHHVLVPDRSSGSFRFRHALFAEAVYATLLPGEREDLHARLAGALMHDPALAASRALAGELAQHWVAAGEPVHALEASLQAARDAQAVSGLGEALHYLEQVLELWDDVPTAEDLAGLALPAVLAWAEELAGMTESGEEDEIDARALAGILGVGEQADPGTVAVRLGVTTGVAGAMLDMLERDGLFEPAGEGAFRPARLAVSEARELYPLVVVLESIAVRQSPPLGPRALDAMRGANTRLRAALHDPSAAIVADDDFHTQLTADCGNERLLAALRPVRRALLRYEQIYMLDPARVERSAAQHDAIIAALERGDQALAAQRVRENLTRGLPDLADALER